MTRVRSLGLACLLVSAGSALLGCAGDDDAGTGGGAPADKAIEAVEQARAESMLVQLSDLPDGWRESPDQDTDEDEIEKCLGIDESDLTIVGEAESQSFEKKSNAISAAAIVYAAAPEAQSSFERGVEVLATPRFAECMKTAIDDALDEEADGEEFTLGDPEAGELSFSPPSGVEDAKAFQMVQPLEARGLTFDLIYEIVALRNGDAIATFATIYYDDSGDPALRDALLQLVADRMAASGSIEGAEPPA